MKVDTISKDPTQDLTDLELGESPNGIEISPRVRMNHDNNGRFTDITNSGDVVDSKEESTLKPSLTSEHDIESGDIATISSSPSKESSKKNTHGFWLLSDKTFSYLHMGVDVFILLSILLQLAVIGVKAKRLRTSKKYGILFLLLLTSAVNVVVALWALYGQYLLSKVPKLRQLINLLRMEVNRMMKENNILSHNISNLEKEQERLHEVEDQLQRIVISQGGNVQQVQRLVQENTTIIQRQKHIIKEQWKQEIIATVLRTDRNGDFVITDHEVDILLQRIESLEEDADVTLSVEERDKLRLILTNGTGGGKIGSVRALIELIGTALED